MTMWTRGEVFTFHHPPEYKITAVAGSGAYAIVCKAEITGRPEDARWWPADDEEKSAEEADPDTDLIDEVQQNDEGESNCKCVNDKTVVAVKQIADFRSEDRTVSEAWELHYLRKVVREIEILIHFQSMPQIIKLIELYTDENQKDLYVVMPFYGHNLRDCIERTPLEERLVRWIIFQILLAVDVVHRCGVIHRDLTLANVLVDAVTGDWTCRLADFGLSRARETCDRDITLDVVTLPYRAPELLLQYPEYDQKVDIWSIGCIMAELFLRRPFLYIEDQNPDHLRQLRLIFKKVTGFPDLEEVRSAASIVTSNYLCNWRNSLEQSNMTIPQPVDVASYFVDPSTGQNTISEQACDVMRKMLVFSPHSRASAKELLNLPWFTEDPELKVMLQEHEAMEALPQFTEFVEKMSFQEMVDLVKTRVSTRRATMISTVQPELTTDVVSPEANS